MSAAERLYTVLCVPSHEGSLKEMLFVSEQLAATGRYRCTFAVNWQCPESWCEKIRRQGHSLILRRKAVRNGGGNHAADQPRRTLADRLSSLVRAGIRHWKASGPKRLLQSILRYLAVEPVVDFGKCWLRYRKAVRRANRLLDEVGPDLVLVPSDRLVGLETALIVHARRRGVPSMVIHWALGTANGPEFLRLSQPDWEITHGMRRWINRLVARWYPELVSEQRGQKLLYLPGEAILAAKAWGVMNPHPWRAPGSGLATRITVEGRHFHEQTIAQGVPAEKLVITGRASTDHLHRALLDAAARRRDVCQELGLRADEPILLCAVPQLAEHGLCSWEAHREGIEFLLSTMASAGGNNVVLSLHPKCKAEDYESAASRHGAVIARNHSIEQLMPLCDVFVSTFSSTVAMAIGCGKPVALLDLWGMNYDMFDGCPGIVILREREDVLPELRRMLEDRAYYEQLVRGHRLVADRWICIDGKCGQRLIAEADALVSVMPKHNLRDPAVSPRCTRSPLARAPHLLGGRFAQKG